MRNYRRLLAQLAATPVEAQRLLDADHERNTEEFSALAAIALQEAPDDSPLEDVLRTLAPLRQAVADNRCSLELHLRRTATWRAALELDLGFPDRALELASRASRRERSQNLVLSFSVEATPRTPSGTSME